MNKIGLADAIAALRAELRTAVAASAKEEIKFEVGEVVVELEVAVEKSVEGSAGVNVWVIDVNAGGTRATTATHRITIPLKPSDRSGAALLTADADIPE